MKREMLWARRSSTSRMHQQCRRVPGADPGPRDRARSGRAAGSVPLRFGASRPAASRALQSQERKPQGGFTRRPGGSSAGWSPSGRSTSTGKATPAPTPSPTRQSMRRKVKTLGGHFGNFTPVGCVPPMPPSKTFISRRKNRLESRIFQARERPSLRLGRVGRPSWPPPDGGLEARPARGFPTPGNYVICRSKRTKSI